MTTVRATVQTSATLPSPAQQREYICRVVGELGQDDIDAAFRFVTSQLSDEIKISRHSNGSSINLDKLSDSSTAKIYSFVRAKTNE